MSREVTPTVPAEREARSEHPPAESLVEQLRKLSPLDEGRARLYRSAADTIERLLSERTRREKMEEALRKITHEHLQFQAYFEDCDHAAQMEARAALESPQ